MSFELLEEKYPDFNLFHLEAMDLYHAINDNLDEFLLDKDGNIIYNKPKLNKNLFYTNFAFLNWTTKVCEFTSQITFWIAYRNLNSYNSCKIYTLNGNNVEELLIEKTIVWAEAISPTKVVLQIAIDQNNLNQGSQISIYDVAKKEYQEITKTSFGRTLYRQSGLVVHEISGMEYLFSVLIDIKNEGSDTGDIEIYRMYNNNGEELLGFDTTIGQNGENTWFENGKRNMGITYRLLNEPISFSSSWYHSEYRACNSLIDAEGNFYGNFYYISGQIPSSLGKTSTRHPKYTDKKLLCLSLPEQCNGVPLLAIVDEHNQITRTKYECPWLFFNYSNALIKDKKLFGKTALLVIDDDGFVRLIDLEGNEIENVEPIKCESLLVNYAKLFVAQASK